MAKGTFPVSAKRLLGLSLIIFSAVSCTYDYFTDENNFELYVPQIQNNEISSFYVAFHDVDGKHVRTRQIEPPFDKDEKMKQGILRFKLYPGQYNISCFCNYASGSITEGNSFADSYKASRKADGADTVYIGGDSDPRALFINATAYPLGHPNSIIPVEADLDESKRFKGRVTTKFEDLPNSIKRIDITYKGLATKLKFNGTFDRFASNDCFAVSLDTTDPALFPSGTTLSYTEVINPSAGINFTDYLASAITTGAQPMMLEVYFYNEYNILIGNIAVSENDISGLDPSKRPKDGEGNPISSLVLEPQKIIIFTFKGFTLFQVELKGWGEIDPGGTTPM